MRRMGNLDQIAPNYATLYFMIHFNAVCEMLSSIMGYNTYINVTFKFTKKFLGPRLCNIISHDLI